MFPPCGWSGSKLVLLQLFIRHPVWFLCHSCPSVPWQKPIEQNNRSHLPPTTSINQMAKSQFWSNCPFKSSNFDGISKLNRRVCTGATSLWIFPRVGIPTPLRIPQIFLLNFLYSLLKVVNQPALKIKELDKWTEGEPGWKGSSLLLRADSLLHHLLVNPL